ncbi:hypothetical protein DVR12_20650 [Chitinophaga silvatica]|uniref:Uncharacterized protein n=1 Tax=Chitinophaga silvatica TaxID=2282649 RepID=A0A3E1Y5W5_9BACT|nr:hypothetical protein [Chitinophaga silvatica]RFS20128.1 hypothetical protein DVR12_20650 [Chitinophaga silvatica]
MTKEERLKLSREPIIWTGDLLDDCTAEWAGLMLRAEWMDEEYWWWAVYDMVNNEETVDSSNEYESIFIGAAAARAKAESVAGAYLAKILTT